MVDGLIVSTPGRICLFGEHQDYLHLPVIPAAISLRLKIEAKQNRDREIRIDLPDISSHDSFSLRTPLQYTKPADYFKSVINVLYRHAFSFSRGLDGIVTSNIPIQAGTSSSSALVVSWVHLLALMSDQGTALTKEDIARYAYEAEVLEFSGAGGMMDQYSTALGGIIAIDFFPELKVEPIMAVPGTFVLGDSQEPKDTQGILSRVKYGVLEILENLSGTNSGFSLYAETAESISRYRGRLPDSQFNLLAGTVRNHDITKQARKLFAQQPLDHRSFGELLSAHHAILRDVQKISTPKIDRMLDAAMNAGAYGGKINGSGGGGCMFAYSPEHPDKVAEAIDRAGGKSYIVSLDDGTRVER
ncbi:MAG: galactokinase family protein [bacterium]